MRYPGGKNADGTWQWIINQIPPHQLYVELFCGSAAVLRHKRPAQRSEAVDLDMAVLDAIRPHVPEGTQLTRMDAIAWLERFGSGLPSATFIYADPPYLATLTRQRYRHRFGVQKHRELIAALKAVPAGVMVAVSGYWCPLYASIRGLGTWRTAIRGVQTRGNVRAEEWLWTNYPEPTELHDYRFLGDDFREREKFRRQQRRWRARLAGMGRLRRLALLAAIREVV